MDVFMSLDLFKNVAGFSKIEMLILLLDFYRIWMRFFKDAGFSKGYCCVLM